MATDLRVDRVTIRRGPDAIIDGLGFTATAGSLVAINGAPGTGKSTALDVVAGRRRPDSGTATLDDTPVGDSRLTHRIAFMSQAHELLPTLTAHENVALGAMSTGTPAVDAWQRARDVLDQLGVPRAAQVNLAEELSGGQHQRVALARTLAGNPLLVVADDPTSELDETSVELALDALRTSAAVGTIVVVATTDPRLLSRADVRVDLDALRAARPVGRTR